MMTELRSDDCDHQWDSDAPVRICRLCGQIRLFPNGDSNPQVLWPVPNIDDPLQLANSDKSLIAGVAKRLGIRKVAKLTDIPWKILRAWVGAYCRKPKSAKLPPATIPAVTMPITLSKLNLGNCLMCERDLLDESDTRPHYILTPSGKIWLCGDCAEGVGRLFKSLAIPYQVKGDKDHE